MMMMMRWMNDIAAAYRLLIHMMLLVRSWGYRVLLSIPMLVRLLAEVMELASLRLQTPFCCRFAFLFFCFALFLRRPCAHKPKCFAHSEANNNTHTPTATANV